MNIIKAFLLLIAPELISVVEIKNLIQAIVKTMKERDLNDDEKNILNYLTKTYEAAKQNNWSKVKIDFKNQSFINKLQKGLGKITDSGNVVPGGAVDEHFYKTKGSLSLKPKDITPKNYTGKKVFMDLFVKLFPSFNLPSRIFNIHEAALYERTDAETVRKKMALRSIEWGSWMSQKDRLGHIIALALSWEDMKTILKVSANKLSIKGALSLAIGARGRRGSLAHFNQLHEYINLNKENGDEALFHEWAHAFDFLIPKHNKKHFGDIASFTGIKKNGSLSAALPAFKTLDEKLNHKYLMISLFEQLFKKLYWYENGKKRDFQIRLAKIKKEQNGVYFRSRVEVWARLMEVYMFHELKSKGIKNDYLVASVYGGRVYPTKQELEVVKPIIKAILKEGFKISSTGKPTLNKGLNGVLSETAAAVKNVKEVVEAVKVVGSTVKSLPKEIKGIFTPLSEINEQESNPVFNISGEIGKFLGNVEKKPIGSVVATLDAEQGAGKTRFVFQIMNALALSGYKGLFISLEEHPSSTLFQQKVQEYLNPAAINNIQTIGEVNDFEEIKNWANYFDFIVIDSWGKIPKSQGRLDELRKAVNGKFIIAIYQQTTTGSMRGGADSAFDGDIIMKINKNADYRKTNAFHNKNRYLDKPLDQVFYNIYSRKIFNPTLVKNQ